MISELGVSDFESCSTHKKIFEVEAMKHLIKAPNHRVTHDIAD